MTDSGIFIETVALTGSLDGETITWKLPVDEYDWMAIRNAIKRASDLDLSWTGFKASWDLYTSILSRYIESWTLKDIKGAPLPRTPLGVQSLSQRQISAVFDSLDVAMVQALLMVDLMAMLE